MKILIGHHKYGTDRVTIWDSETHKEVGSIRRAGKRWDIYRGDTRVDSEATMKAARLSASLVHFNARTEES